MPPAPPPPRPRWRKALHRLWLALGGVSLLFLLWWGVWPLPGQFGPLWKPPVVTVTDRHGELLRELPPPGQPRLLPVPLKAVDPVLARWVVASEDRRFFAHHGVDWPAVGRALWVNLKARRAVQGASTITMQAVRLSLGKHPWRWWQKLREVLWAVKLERHLGKREILSLYLNRLPFSHNAVGVQAGARTYFGYGASLLSQPQASLLVSLIRAPGVDPLRHPKTAEARRRAWVRRMARTGRLAITPAAARALERTAPLLNPAPPADEAPQLVAWALRQVPPQARRVETTLDLRLHRLALAQAQAVVGGLASRQRSRAAVMVVRTRTGEVLAYVAEARHRPARERHDLPRRPRQPGSALKPFTYALAFDRGFHPASLLADVPSDYTLPAQAGGGVFRPHNYDGLFHGPVRARVALGASLNVAAVDLARQLGPARLWRFYRAVGLPLPGPPKRYGVGVTLGNAEVRLTDLTGAYATLGRLGVKKPLRVVRRWRGADGRWRWPKPPTPKRVMGRQAAFLVADILRDDLARASAFGRRSVLTFPFPVAAKTGTSSDYRDNWAMGYTPDFTYGVWVGNVSGQSLGGVSGITGAGPLFQRVVRLVQGRRPARWFTPPTGLKRRPVCALSGLAPGPHCPGTVEEWLPQGLRLPPDNWHQPHPQQPGVVQVRWPPRYLPWAASQGLVGSGATPRAKQAAPSPAGEQAGEEGFWVQTPAPGQQVLLSAALPRSAQVLTLTVSPGGGPPYDWTLDGLFLGTTSLPGRAWPLAPGRHTLVVRDGEGRQARRDFDVIPTTLPGR